MKSIPYSALLGLVLLTQAYHLLSVGQNIPPETSPLAFYRRTLITQDRETIGSLGGAPVGLYRRRFPYQQSFSSSPKVRSQKPWKQLQHLKGPDLLPISSSFSFIENRGNSQNVSVIKRRNRNPRRRVTRLRITKIIKDLFKTKNEKRLKSKLVSFGLGIGLGTILGSILPKELLQDR